MLIKYAPPLPPTEVVEFPERYDHTSNAPLPAVDKLISKDPSAEVVAKTTKRNGSDLCPPKAKKDLPSTISCNEITFNIPAPLCCVLRNPQCLQTVQILLSGRASQSDRQHPPLQFNLIYGWTCFGLAWSSSRLQAILSSVFIIQYLYNYFRYRFKTWSIKLSSTWNKNALKEASLSCQRCCASCRWHGTPGDDCGLPSTFRVQTAVHHVYRTG